MAPSIVVIAQARMGSSRLPGKVLREVVGRTLLEHLVRRVQRSRYPVRLVIATTTTAGDAAVLEEAARLGVQGWAGPVDDVLARYVQAAEAAGAGPEDVLVRVTGDCPLLDAGELDRLLDAFLAAQAAGEPLDYLTNQAGAVRRIPRGLDVEVFTYAALLRAFEEATEPGDREHVTPWLYRTPGRFRAEVSHAPGPDLGHLRLTVDTPADLAVVQAVFEALGEDATTAGVASWLAAHPEVAALNAEVQQKGIGSEMEVRRQRIGGRLLLGRADGGPGVGFGHIARLEALLDAWTSLGGRAALRAVGVGGSIRQRLEAAGVEIVDITPVNVPDPSLPPEQRPLPHPDDLAMTLAAAEGLGAAAIATDGYAFDAGYLGALRGWGPLLSIDDMAAFPHPADVIVNQNLGFEAGRYVTTSPGAALRVGHPFALFRREVREAVFGPVGGAGEAGRRVILTFGGADPARLSAPVARALLAAAPEDVTLDVIAGRAMASEDQAQLALLAAEHPGRLVVHYDVARMAELLRGARLALTAAGSTVWELLALGVPPLLVAVASNQRAVTAGVARFGVGEDLGLAGELTPEAIAGRAAALLEDPAALEVLVRRGQALIDGRGVYRAIDALLDAMDRRAAAPPNLEAEL